MSTSKTGHALSSHDVVLVLKGFYADVNVFGASSHSGGRTIVICLAERDISSFVMKESAGHESIATTQGIVGVGGHQIRNATDF